MPNHVQNRIEATPDVIEMLCSSEGADFNRIIPAPELIAKYDSVPSHVETAAEIALGVLDFNIKTDSDIRSITHNLHLNNSIRQLKEGPFVKDFNDADFEQFIDYLRCFKQCGYCNWYQWNTANWGTKWNGYSTVRVSPVVVEFQTAWSAPHPVIEKLADRFPLTQIIHKWADEDTGSNCGIRRYIGVLAEETKPESGSKEAYELAFDLHPSSAADYAFSAATGTYEYQEA